MDTQNDIAYYYRRAAEARARGREVLAQSMENYARNLEAGIYNDNGHGINIGDWSKKEAPQQQAATRRSNEDALYEKARPAMTPVAKPQKSRSQAPQMSGYGPGYTEPLEYEAPKTGPGYTEPPMDYPVVPKGGYGSYNPAPAKVGPGYTEPPMDYAAPVIGRRSPERASAEDGLYEKARPALSPQGHSGFVGWLESKFPSKAASANSVADFRRRDEAAGYAPKQSGIPEFELPPMTVTADAPRKQKSVPKLKGQAPGGGTPLTNYYAGQLKDTPYEANEGYNGIEYGSSGLVNRMRDLCRLVPYDETDGTNCARTISAALDGTPYSGFYNVDQFIDVAARNGQLRDANSGYQPQAGDLAVTNNGNHIVMVTENGGTIQNGKSRNGVYETDQKPSEQKGGAQYYITTSDYSNLYPSFHFDTGLGGNDLFGGR